MTTYDNYKHRDATSISQNTGESMVVRVTKDYVDNDKQRASTVANEVAADIWGKPDAVYTTVVENPGGGSGPIYRVAVIGPDARHE